MSSDCVGRALAAILASALALCACTSPRALAPAPSLYSDTARYPLSAIAPAEQTASAELIYYTDRAFDVGEGRYSGARSAAVSVGRVRVQIGEAAQWPDILAASWPDAGPRDRLALSLDRIEDRSVLPPTPVPFAFVNGAIVEDAEARARYDAAMQRFQDRIRARAARTGADRVLVYVHGFNNTFEDAAYALTDIWHYSGRGSIPILFSWPSRSGGPLGYLGDRESGEFSVFHLKEMIRALAAVEEIQALDVVAHSRGTDVTTTALRELVIEARGGGRSPREAYKVRNLVLAAPDLDLEVVEQRLIAEQFGPAIGRITIYTNPEDSALGVSSFITRGLRFGRVRSGDLNVRVQQIFEGVRNVHFVSAERYDGLIGHSYFREHPGILADLCALLLTDAPPGSVQRPLRRVSGNFFIAADDYAPRLDAAEP